MAINLLPMIALFGTALLLSKKDDDDDAEVEPKNADPKPLPKPGEPEPEPEPETEPEEGVLLRDMDCVFVGRGEDGGLSEGVARSMAAVADGKSPILVTVWNRGFFDEVMATKLRLTRDVCDISQIVVVSYEDLYESSVGDTIADAEARAEVVYNMVNHPEVDIGKLKGATRILLERFKRDLQSGLGALKASQGYVIVGTDAYTGSSLLSVAGPEIALTDTPDNEFKVYEDIMEFVKQYSERRLGAPPLFSYFDESATVQEFESDLDRTFKFVGQQQESLQVLERFSDSWEDVF